MTEDEMMRKYAAAHGCGEEKHICYYCGRPAYIRKILIGDDDAIHWLCDECNAKHNAMLENADNKSAKINDDYPQAHEPNEYRYLSPAWLDEIAKGLTAGQEKYPGETWREIPAREHAWRAVRHLVLYLKGDKADTHLINAAMRTMMAFETDAAENSTIEWEKLMREKGCG